MPFTNAGTANPSSNVSRQSKHSILLKSYTKAFAATILVHVPWLLEYIEPGTSGRPLKQTIRTMSESANHAKNMTTSSTKQKQLHHIISPWPFAKWGMDIPGPFSPGKGQVKFLIVAIDYFTKWIEAKPLTTITAQQVQQFVWKDIVCRYGVPHTIITDNGRQFIDNELAKFYIGLDIKDITSSVEHPQTNGQAEAANKVILMELRKRLDSAKG